MKLLQKAYFNNLENCPIAYTYLRVVSEVLSVYRIRLVISTYFKERLVI